ncbi:MULTISPECIES: type II and III secretion system protein family protein [unclassified Pseudidiomarina]|uniref:type II and III secretion system protein family protein n=1 Tax=Pseudidiomarina salilacus TaxID=3384452 RepID=UPI003984E90A
MLTMLWLLTLGLTSPASSNDHQLFVDETLVIPMHDANEVVLTKPEVLSHQALPSGQLVLTGKSAGSSQILLFQQGAESRRITVTVIEPPDEQLRHVLLALQRRFPDLQIVEVGELIQLSGPMSEAHKVEFAALFAAQPKLINHLVWQPAVQPPMLELEVLIAEVKRSYSEHLGVRWPAHLNGPLVEDLGSWIHLPVSAQATLDLLEREGHAELLANPVLSVLSGSSANFLVGGEFPIPQVLAQGMQDVSFRDYGIKLQMRAERLTDGQIHTDLTAEMSSIDPATAVNGIPGLLSRKVGSSFVIPDGETLVLSGLLQSEQSAQADRFPWLHQLPILGQLFASEQFRNAETELMILVTPRTAKLPAEEQQLKHQQRLSRRSFHQQVGCSGLVNPFTEHF